jgi:hypothetical protein
MSVRVNTPIQQNAEIKYEQKTETNKLRGFSPRANYTD